MPEDTTELQATGSAWLIHPNGVHARPAIKLTKLAKRFAARVELGVSSAGPWVDAKSVSSILGMKTPSGVELFFRGAGSDAPAAVAALVALVEADFTDDAPA